MHPYQINQVAYLNADLLKSPPRALLIDHHGLGHTEYRSNPWEFERELANRNILTAFPYVGPWSWMNRETRSFIDDLIEKIRAQYQLPNLPIIHSGGSMGGMSSLLITRYSRHTTTACIALMPPTDAKIHFSERPDVARTMLAAFRNYPEDLDSVFLEQSPLHQVPHLPNIPYFLHHGTADKSVSKTLHFDPLIAAMKKRNLNLEYYELEGVGHEGTLPMTLKRLDFIERVLSTPAAKI